MLINLITFCLTCLIALPAFATEADFEKRMARGVAALDAQNATLALEEFQAAIKEHPNDPEAALYLAIALNRANDPNAESALKTALRLDPGNSRINLELGTFYYNSKMYEEAADYFENLLTQTAEPEMQTAAKGYLADIRSRSGTKRWGATAVVGVQYDSNVPLVADKGLLPEGTKRKGDLRGVVNLGFNGIAFRDSSQELSGSISLYQALHLQLSNFNLTQITGESTYKREISRLFTGKASVGAESILLGGKQFVSDFSITPGLFASFREGMTSGLEYRFRNSFFKNSAPLFPTNSDRNGISHALILTHRQPLSETLNLRLGYTVDRDTASKSAWSSTSHQASAGVGVSLPNALLLDVSLEGGNRKYDKRLDEAKSVRSETSLTGAMSLTWQMSERLCASVGYHYTTNNSNIPDYDYSRGITSIMVQGRY